MNVENACIYRSVAAVAVPLVTINLKRIMRQVVEKQILHFVNEKIKTNVEVKK